MKTSNALLIIFAIIASWYGWMQYEAHQAAKKAAQDKATREMFEGYERCTAHISDPSSKAGQDAAEGCRRFWFEGRW